VEAVRARVQVVVPVEALGAFETLEAFDTESVSVVVAELAGAGPVPLESARRLAGEAPVWERVTVDACSGSVLSVDRYRPSEQMRRLLAARDQHCRFPGCRVPVSRCDLDHTIDAALGGATSTQNLAHLCRGHHVLKHHSGWRVRQSGDGDLCWTSPTGARIRDRPPSRVRFARAERNEQPHPF
ncbi:HNH endonuclease signature motif containing protein, partial [Leucobacter sp. USCH14]|uniref:HNH endonuclease signature motif containing protein n=1 Tax=Leucobacter sp. USCH14 TaxID=3024838 RepID=UPI0030965A71